MLCCVGAGPEPAQRERLEPRAIALDPLMRPAGPSGRRIGAQGRDEVGRADATRVRGQLRPHLSMGAGHRQRQDGRADVVVDLTTLPLPPHHEDRGGEQLRHPLPQILTWHAEHLQLPITRCYLLLERPLRLFDHCGGLHLDTLGQQGGQRRRQLLDRRLSRSRRPEPHLEVLPAGLTARGEGQPEAHQRVWDEPLGVRDGQPAAPQGPFPHPRHVAVARETNLAGLRETQAQAALLVGRHDVGQEPRLTRRTGMRPPSCRSCPVPWLPPAGGTGEATTCSSPNPVHAPQS